MLAEVKDHHGKQVKPYWLYLLECVGDKFYTGIALDVEKRFSEHCSSPKGAAYTKANKPLRVLAKKQYGCKGDALRAEFAVKKLKKSKKLSFFVDVSGAEFSSQF